MPRDQYNPGTDEMEVGSDAPAFSVRVEQNGECRVYAPGHNGPLIVAPGESFSWPVSIEVGPAKGGRY